MKFSSISTAAILAALSAVQAAPLSAYSSTTATNLAPRNEAAALRDANQGNGLSPAENAAIDKQDNEAAGPVLSDRKLKVRLSPAENDKRNEAAALRDANQGNGLSPAENAAIDKQDNEAAGPVLSD
ncbi:hypothetical protein LX32DRAFT_655839 [Colletotrichum zoysiae]|uniref:Uncharacterized protein n=1 Tax=Colletotrichum zoysiae TaxID=1216348 RepID=A0AAD9H9Y7_9PEZI|nr:hypothetical protein LX32DRAFT_655839 [Colletotrichum zoysiae]